MQSRKTVGCVKGGDRLERMRRLLLLLLLEGVFLCNEIRRSGIEMSFVWLMAFERRSTSWSQSWSQSSWSEDEEWESQKLRRTDTLSREGSERDRGWMVKRGLDGSYGSDPH